MTGTKLGSAGKRPELHALLKSNMSSGLASPPQILHSFGEHSLDAPSCSIARRNNESSITRFSATKCTIIASSQPHPAPKWLRVPFYRPCIVRKAKDPLRSAISETLNFLCRGGDLFPHGRGMEPFEPRAENARPWHLSLGRGLS